MKTLLTMFCFFRNFPVIISAAIIVFSSCDSDSHSRGNTIVEGSDPIPLVFADGSNISTAIDVPEGYVRSVVTSNSFAEYLRKLPLKPSGSPVLRHNGELKDNQNAHVAVVDLPIGRKNLHQCADAAMRLRAEYLWKRGLYSKIHFNFTSGFRADYSKWMEGYRIVMNGNDARWVKSAAASNSYDSFWKYLEMVFSYAGSLSLSKELKAVGLDEMEIGDIFIRGGTPGHVVMVVDMAVQPQSGQKLFLLAQSFMPAQEIEILKNPNSNSLSPWYSLDFKGDLQTPDWLFYRNELKRFN
ncbi:MAG: DUF4846 domain-containing protein [Bacteroidota bacterium]|jgi:hypothetical protein